MKKGYTVALFGIIALGAILVFSHFVSAGNLAILNPKGLIAQREKDLMVFATILSLFVVIPVFILTFFIVWKYREGNTKARYTPNWDQDKKLEFVWWGVPCLVILILGTLTWTSSHELDPYKTLSSTTKPLVVQVVALQWKWLFIYPEQHVASVNYVQFPENTPIDFVITADAPMNSFWIPELGGQIYAMPGMSTQLHLIASGLGSYRGDSANLSGTGFAGMKFMAQSSSQSDFDNWVSSLQQSPHALTSDEYAKLATPSENSQISFYSANQNDLYNQIMMKFMMPTAAEEAVSQGSQPNNSMQYMDMSGMYMGNQ